MPYSNKLKSIFFGITIFFCQNTLFGQDIIPYGLYFNNWKVVNPASAGLSGSQKFDITYRANNTKFDYNPSYALISWENRLIDLNSGLGIIFENRQIGPRTRVYASALYDYQINLNEENKLSFGANFNFLSETFDFSSFRPIDPNDPILAINSSSSNAFDLGLGVVFKSKTFHVGIAVRNLLESKIENSEIDLLTNNTIQHLTAYGEYQVEFRNFRFIPSTYLYTDYENIFFDLNPTLEFMKLLLIGGTFRISNDNSFVNVNAGINWNDKIQLIGIVYSSGYEGEGNNFEFSLSISIDQK